MELSKWIKILIVNSSHGHSASLVMFVLIVRATREQHWTTMNSLIYKPRK